MRSKSHLLRPARHHRLPGFYRLAALDRPHALRRTSVGSAKPLLCRHLTTQRPNCQVPSGRLHPQFLHRSFVIAVRPDRAIPRYRSTDAAGAGLAFDISPARVRIGARRHAFAAGCAYSFTLKWGRPMTELEQRNLATAERYIDLYNNDIERFVPAVHPRPG